MDEEFGSGHLRLRDERPNDERQRHNNENTSDGKTAEAEETP